MKSSKVSIETRSIPGSISFKGQATKHTSVNWSIQVVRKSLNFLDKALVLEAL